MSEPGEGSEDVEEAAVEAIKAMGIMAGDEVIRDTLRR